LGVPVTGLPVSVHAAINMDRMQENKKRYGFMWIGMNNEDVGMEW
jgi:hypothetical protein